MPALSLLVGHPFFGFYYHNSICIKKLGGPVYLELEQATSILKPKIPGKELEALAKPVLRVLETLPLFLTRPPLTS